MGSSQVLRGFSESERFSGCGTPWVNFSYFGEGDCKRFGELVYSS